MYIIGLIGWHRKGVSAAISADVSGQQKNRHVCHRWRKKSKACSTLGDFRRTYWEFLSGDIFDADGKPRHTWRIPSQRVKLPLGLSPPIGRHGIIRRFSSRDRQLQPPLGNFSRRFLSSRRIKPVWSLAIVQSLATDFQSLVGVASR